MGIGAVRPGAPKPFENKAVLIDPWGRVLGLTDHFSGAPTMIAEVPLGAVPTVYARIGDVFAWLCVAGCAVAVIVALATGRSASLHPFD